MESEGMGFYHFTFFSSGPWLQKDVFGQELVWTRNEKGEFIKGLPEALSTYRHDKWKGKRGTWENIVGYAKKSAAFEKYSTPFFIGQLLEAVSTVFTGLDTELHIQEFLVTRSQSTSDIIARHNFTDALGGSCQHDVAFLEFHYGRNIFDKGRHTM